MTTTATPRRINVELLDRIEQQITEHPETWNQNAWFLLPEDATFERDHRDTRKPLEPPCGTAFCVAGWAVSFAGYKLATPGIDSREGSECFLPGVPEPVLIEDVAAGLLGLTQAQASALFDSDNSLEDIQAHIASLREEANR